MVWQAHFIFTFLIKYINQIFYLYHVKAGHAQTFVTAIKHRTSWQRCFIKKLFKKFSEIQTEVLLLFESHHFLNDKLTQVQFIFFFGTLRVSKNTNPKSMINTEFFCNNLSNKNHKAYKRS